MHVSKAAVLGLISMALYRSKSENAAFEMSTLPGYVASSKVLLLIINYYILTQNQAI